MVFYLPTARPFFTVQGTFDANGAFAGTATQYGYSLQVPTTGSIKETNHPGQSRSLDLTITIHESLTIPPRAADDITFVSQPAFSSPSADPTPQVLRSCVGFAGAGGEVGAYYSSSGIPAMDNFVFGQSSLLIAYWGIQCNVDFMDDRLSPNSFSDSQNRQMHFGVALLGQTDTQYGDLAALGIMAHEYGHQIEGAVAPSVFTYANQSALPTRQEELEADSFSGFYLAATQNASWAAVQAYYANTYNHGSWDYTNPTWHGTGQNRLDATMYGVNTLNYLRATAQSATLLQLHQIFYGATYSLVWGGGATASAGLAPSADPEVEGALRYLRTPSQLRQTVRAIVPSAFDALRSDVIVSSPRR
jgi:hypothetical protein